MRIQNQILLRISIWVLKYLPQVEFGENVQIFWKTLFLAKNGQEEDQYGKHWFLDQCGSTGFINGNVKPAQNGLNVVLLDGPWLGHPSP